MNPTELEALIERELRELPQPTAPHTLLPRVLAAAEQWNARPWYRRPWMDWPRGWQAASAVVMCACVAAIGVFMFAAGWSAVSEALQSTGIAAAWGQLAGLFQRAYSLVLALLALGAVVVRAILELGLLAPVAALLAIMVSACMAVLLALDQLVTGKAFRL